MFKDSEVINLFYLIHFLLFQAEDLKAETTRLAIPLPDAYPAEAPRKITSEERDFSAFRTLRVARANQRHEGARKARAAKVSQLLFSLSVTCSNSSSTLNRKRRRKQQRKSKPTSSFTLLLLRLDVLCLYVKIWARRGDMRAFPYFILCSYADNASACFFSWTTCMMYTPALIRLYVSKIPVCKIPCGASFESEFARSTSVSFPWLPPSFLPPPLPPYLPLVQLSLPDPPPLAVLQVPHRFL